MNRLSNFPQRYILYSSIGMVFSEAAAFHVGFDFRIFYVVMALNTLLLISIWNFRLPRGYLQVLATMWFMGAIPILRSTDTVLAFVEQALGITICSFYFYLFFSARAVSLARIFDLYVQAAYWVTVVGLAICADQTLSSGEFHAVKSILIEPAQFSAVVMPALYHLLHEAIRLKKHRFRALVLLLGVALSGSSTGFFGLVVCCILLVRRRPIRTIVVAGALIVAGWGLYSFDDHFRIRIDDTISGASGFDLSTSNVSTFAFLTNLYAASRAFQDHPIIGCGLGAHQFAHDRYIGKLPDFGKLEEFADINKRDANSLFLRITSELGLIGIGALVWYIVRFHIRTASEHAEISAAILTYFFPKLLRDGHWFSAEMYFFVWLYVLVAQESQIFKFSRRPILSLQDGEPAPRIVSALPT